MSDQPPEPPHRRPNKTGPAVVALLSLSACGAQSAPPRADLVTIEAPPAAAVAVVTLPGREAP